MDIGVKFQRLCHVQVQRLLLIMGISVAVVILFQLSAHPYKNYSPTISHFSNGSQLLIISSATRFNSSKSTNVDTIHDVVNSIKTSDLGEMVGYENETEGEDKDYDFESYDHQERDYIESYDDQKILNRSSFENDVEHSDADSRIPLLSVAANVSVAAMKSQPKDVNLELLQSISVVLSNNSSAMGYSIMRKRNIKTTSITDMNLLLLKSYDSSNAMRRQRSSIHDRDLQYARLQIENAPIVRNAPGLYAPIFRNFSMFKRSYELMERMLKIYIYKEGEKPIFHGPKLTGIYASEGWFMKVMEGNKQFVVRDPRKAHLFYLPFSSKMLRIALDGKKLASQRDLEKYLKNYINMIAVKYRFWNRTRGADHFLVACHDWAPRMTRNIFGNSTRVLCNTNLASGFKIGKDVSLPVTSVRTSRDPLKYIGGKPSSERSTLAFFAGNIHGYLRPVLLHYWMNKEPDMKIFGPMARDNEGKAKYMEYMKSSKYCICARGYEVHTPRVVESILYECVPVIISDNYVPPFFEVLNWESFAVFVLEKDVPNLRNILLSIPEEKYLLMQQRVKMVQQHFFWHKKAVKYDLFHMILHSVWYNRVFQVKSR